MVSDADVGGVALMSRMAWWRLGALLVLTAALVLGLWELALWALDVHVPEGSAWLLRSRALVTAAALAAVAGLYVGRVGRAYGSLLAVRRMEAQLDCAPVTVVRLDASGRITHVNEAWRRFARDNGADAPTIAGVGLGYLEVLASARAPELQEVAADLADVLAGRRPNARWEYACHAPTAVRWFTAEARGLDDGATVIVHTDVTEAQLASGRERAHATLAQVVVLGASVPEAAAAFAQKVSAELEWPLAALWLPSAAAPGALACAEAWAIDPALAPAKDALMAAGALAASALFAAGAAPSAPEWLDLDADEASPCAHADRAAPFGLRTRVAFAVEADGEVLAVVELYCPVRRRFDLAFNGLVMNAAQQLSVGEGRRRAEAAAALAARRHSTLFQSSRDALMTLTPPTWTFTRANDACLKLFGAKGEADFVARGPWELSPELQADGRPSGEGAKANIETAMREGSCSFPWTHQTLDGRPFPASVLLSRIDLDGESFLQATVRDESALAKARADEQAARSRLDSIVSCAPVVLLTTDREGTVTFINQRDAAAQALVGATWLNFVPGAEHDQHRARFARVLQSGVSETYEARGRVAEGEPPRDFSVHLGPLRQGDTIVGVVVAALDVTELRRTQAEVTAGQRLSAMGTLAAGVAHEINTPVQFVSDSMNFLSDACRDLFGVVFAEREVGRLAAAGVGADDLERALAAAREAEAEADLDYLQDQMPKAFERCSDGLARIATIVRSMKEFAHPAQKEMAPADLNRAIMSTLTIATNEYKYVADLETDLQPLPPVTCFISDLNQVVLNLVVNAAHAIGDVVGSTGARGRIRVATRHEGDEAVVELCDTGTGMPPELLGRIFEPFFTTKAVGKGTGQGLALAWAVVQEKHGGTLRVASVVGEGTTFTIRLPVAGKKERAAAGIAPPSSAPPATEPARASRTQAA
ncbi:MAG: PAS domain-containing protein [Deltaproteobacteria bacterium]|nr:PAS domain-containing protein [Deltaproteobacteria bacterium]